jgi:hypothetical protein
MVARSSLLLLVALLAASVAVADVEGILALGTFRIESPGIGDSGPITLSGSQGHEGIQSLTVQAFGKQLSLSPAQLQGLHSVVFNGVQLSYSGGYKQLGGRTIYVTFSKGFTSGVVGRHLVEITESGTVRVRSLP